MSQIESGDLVSCSIENCTCEGTYITSRDGFAIIKMSSGYNIAAPEKSLKLVEKITLPEPGVAEIVQDKTLPVVSIISTGGTIASKIDYRTGAVTSQFRAEDILEAIPGLSKIAQFRTVQLCNILSENMTPEIWQKLSHAIYDEIKAGAKGIIVTHGTDTMAYSAAAVSFMVRTPVPVIFVGSQRSADRPSSDNVINGLCAAATAISDLGEVSVVMHDGTSDDLCAIHRGTRVRKMHTSRRDAFQSPESESLGKIEYPSLKVTLSEKAIKRDSRKLELFDKLSDKCGLLWYYPGMDPAFLKAYKGYRGLVIAGTGLGHTGTDLISQLHAYSDDGMLIVMTSQCLHGRVCDRVYDTGRDLIAAGIIEGENLLPEVALVKLMWVLGQTDSREEAIRLMRTSIAGEQTARSYND